MKVAWTEAALADLRAVQAYIARRSPRYADAMVQRIIDRTDSLPQHPLIGSVVPEYDAELLRELLESPYRIIYRVLPGQIDSLRSFTRRARCRPAYPARLTSGRAGWKYPDLARVVAARSNLPAAIRNALLALID